VKPSPLLLCDTIPLTAVATGSRHWKNRDRVWRILDGLWQLTEGALKLGVGDCPTGLDLAVAEWEAHNWPSGSEILTVYRADWDRYGDAAGPMRNREMVRKMEPDIGLAFFTNHPCRGTHGCVNEIVKWDSSTVIHMYEE
jgi:hypothetical protein